MFIVQSLTKDNIGIVLRVGVLYSAPVTVRFCSDYLKEDRKS